MEYPVELACPHDGWYNGNPKLMILNGTYADYRHRLVMWVEKGKITASTLADYDKQWAAMDIADKKDRRNAVLESIKKTPVRQKDGKVEYVAKPSDNGRSAIADRKPQLRRQLVHRQPLGSLDTLHDPLAAEEAQLMAKKSIQDVTLPAPEDGAKGHRIPEVVPGMVTTPPAPTPAAKQPAPPALASAM